MLAFLINILLNALTLLIISKIPPVGIEVRSPIAALFGGAVIGIFNGIWGLFPKAFQWATGILSLGIVPLIGSMIVFGLSAWFVEGFRLRWGFWSVLMGAIAFAIVNSIMFWLFRSIGLV